MITRMSTTRTMLGTMLLALVFGSCGGAAGSGSRSTLFGGAAYGVDGDGISYVLFTNAETVATTSGGARKLSGPVSYGAFQLTDSSIEYSCDGDTLSLLENDYELANGRVFGLVSADGEYSVVQLDLPIERATDDEDEIDRLAGLAEVTALFQGH